MGEDDFVFPPLTLSEADRELNDNPLNLSELERALMRSLTPEERQVLREQCTAFAFQVLLEERRPRGRFWSTSALHPTSRHSTSALHPTSRRSPSALHSTHRRSTRERLNIPVTSHSEKTQPTPNPWHMTQAMRERISGYSSSLSITPATTTPTTATPTTSSRPPLPTPLEVPLNSPLAARRRVVRGSRGAHEVSSDDGNDGRTPSRTSSTNHHRQFRMGPRLGASWAELEQQRLHRRDLCRDWVRNEDYSHLIRRTNDDPFGVIGEEVRYVRERRGEGEEGEERERSASSSSLNDDDDNDDNEGDNGDGQVQMQMHYHMEVPAPPETSVGSYYHFTGEEDEQEEEGLSSGLALVEGREPLADRTAEWHNRNNMQGHGGRRGAAAAAPHRSLRREQELWRQQQQRQGLRENGRRG